MLTQKTIGTPSLGSSGKIMIIDCHGHYTTMPQRVTDLRPAHVKAFESGKPDPDVPICSDDGVRQLPQSPGVPASNCVAELERCVKELGFIGCNLSPDASGGYWKDGIPITDRSFYPLYEKMVELDVPAMVHVTASCNPAIHFT